MGRLLQERAALAFEVIGTPRRPAATARVRAERERQLAVLDEQIAGLDPWRGEEAR
jgi:hypothetical protein